MIPLAALNKPPVQQNHERRWSAEQQAKTWPRRRNSGPKYCSCIVASPASCGWTATWPSCGRCLCGTPNGRRFWDPWIFKKNTNEQHWPEQTDALKPRSLESCNRMKQNGGARACARGCGTKRLQHLCNLSENRCSRAHCHHGGPCFWRGLFLPDPHQLVAVGVQLVQRWRASAQGGPAVHKFPHQSANNQLLARVCLSASVCKFLDVCLFMLRNTECLILFFSYKTPFIVHSGRPC